MGSTTKLTKPAHFQRRATSLNTNSPANTASQMPHTVNAGTPCANANISPFPNAPFSGAAKPFFYDSGGRFCSRTAVRANCFPHNFRPTTLVSRQKNALSRVLERNRYCRLDYPVVPKHSRIALLIIRHVNSVVAFLVQPNMRLFSYIFRCFCKINMSWSNHESNEIRKRKNT